MYIWTEKAWRHLEYLSASLGVNLWSDPLAKKLDALGKMSALALGRWASRFKILHSQATLFRTSSSTYFFTSSTANKSEDPVRPEPPPIRVSLTESAGRGVFATRRIGAGDLIHTARPLVAHPLLSTTHSVCYFCLRKLKATSQTQAIQFCSNECEEQSMVYMFKYHPPRVWSF